MLLWQAVSHRPSPLSLFTLTLMAQFSVQMPLHLPQSVFSDSSSSEDEADADKERMDRDIGDTDDADWGAAEVDEEQEEEDDGGGLGLSDEEEDAGAGIQDSDDDDSDHGMPKKIKRLRKAPKKAPTHPKKQSADDWARQRVLDGATIPFHWNLASSLPVTIRVSLSLLSTLFSLILISKFVECFRRCDIVPYC